MGLGRACPRRRELLFWRVKTISVHEELGLLARKLQNIRRDAKTHKIKQFDRRDKMLNKLWKHSIMKIALSHDESRFT